MSKALFISNRFGDKYTGASVVSKLNYEYMKHFFGESNVSIFCLSNVDTNVIMKFLKVIFLKRIDGMTIKKER